MSSRKYVEAPELTAQPRLVSEELMSSPIAESGLSISPEDFGKQFLSGAMEQANFESMEGTESAEVYPTEGALTDGSLNGAVWDADTYDVWERTVALSLQSGGLTEARGEDPIEMLFDEDEKQEEVDRELDPELPEVIVTRSAIHGGSMMDYETDELGGVASPVIVTDEVANDEQCREAALAKLQATASTGRARRRHTSRVANAR